MEWLFGKKEEKKKEVHETIQIKISPKADLKKFELSTGFVMPKKPEFKNKEKLKEEAKEMEGKFPFDIDKVYDLTKYEDRFKMQLTNVNPLMFFITKAQITEAKEDLFKYRIRLEAAKNMKSMVYMTPEEIEKIKRASNIVGGAVHPDTNEIIPFYMKLSGFVVFNMPLVFAVVFAK